MVFVIEGDQGIVEIEPPQLLDFNPERLEKQSPVTGQEPTERPR
jgi:hypothetical protein